MADNFYQKSFLVLLQIHINIDYLVKMKSKKVMLFLS